MTSGFNRSRCRCALAAATACAVLIAVGAPVASDASQPPPCPAGFGLGALTFDAALHLPRFQSGLDAGAYTVDELAAGFADLDSNDNGVICFKDAVGYDHAFPYFYNVIDDLVR